MNLKKILPLKFRSFIYQVLPKLQPTNTYILKRNELVKPLHKIAENYYIRELTIQDANLLRQAYGNKSNFVSTILPRLEMKEWVGLAVFDKRNGKIAYISWIITNNTDFINEFNIILKSNQCFLRHGYCVPEYRHQGLHTRMEQERINYAIINGKNEMFIQIGSDNKKGIKSVSDNNFKLFKQSTIIRFPYFGVYRDYNSFLKNPFKKVI